MLQTLRPRMPRSALAFPPLPSATAARPPSPASTPAPAPVRLRGCIVPSRASPLASPGEEVRFAGCTVLEQAIVKIHEVMPPIYVADVVTLTSTRMLVGASSLGTGLMVDCLERIASVWNDRYDKDVVFEHCFVAEQNGSKRTFLLQAHAHMTQAVATTDRARPSARPSPLLSHHFPPPAPHSTNHCPAVSPSAPLHTLARRPSVSSSSSSALWQSAAGARDVARPGGWSWRLSDVVWVGRGVGIRMLWGDVLDMGSPAWQVGQPARVRPSCGQHGLGSLRGHFDGIIVVPSGEEEARR